MARTSRGISSGKGLRGGGKTVLGFQAARNAELTAVRLFKSISSSVFGSKPSVLASGSAAAMRRVVVRLASSASSPPSASSSAAASAASAAFSSAASAAAPASAAASPAAFTSLALAVLAIPGSAVKGSLADGDVRAAVEFIGDPAFEALVSSEEKKHANIRSVFPYVTLLLAVGPHFKIATRTELRWFEDDVLGYPDIRAAIVGLGNSGLKGISVKLGDGIYLCNKVSGWCVVYFPVPPRTLHITDGGTSKRQFGEVADAQFVQSTSEIRVCVPLSGVAAAAQILTCIADAVDVARAPQREAVDEEEQPYGGALDVAARSASADVAASAATTARAAAASVRTLADALSASLPTGVDLSTVATAYAASVSEHEEKAVAAEKVAVAARKTADDWAAAAYRHQFQQQMAAAHAPLDLPSLRKPMMEEEEEGEEDDAENTFSPQQEEEEESEDDNAISSLIVTEDVTEGAGAAAAAAAV